MSRYDCKGLNFCMFVYKGPVQLKGFFNMIVRYCGFALKIFETNSMEQLDYLRFQCSLYHLLCNLKINNNNHIYT